MPLCEIKIGYMAYGKATVYKIKPVNTFGENWSVSSILSLNLPLRHPS